MRHCLLLAMLFGSAYSLQPVARATRSHRSFLMSTEKEETEIFQAFDDEPIAPTTEAANQEEKDEDEFQKVRVLTYMGLSLVPILTILPFFAGRDFVPADPSQFT